MAKLFGFFWILLYSSVGFAQNDLVTGDKYIIGINTSRVFQKEIFVSQDPFYKLDINAKIFRIELESKLTKQLKVGIFLSVLNRKFETIRPSLFDFDLLNAEEHRDVSIGGGVVVKAQTGPFRLAIRYSRHFNTLKGLFLTDRDFINNRSYTYGFFENNEQDEEWWIFSMGYTKKINNKIYITLGTSYYYKPGDLTYRYWEDMALLKESIFDYNFISYDLSFDYNF